MQIDTSLLSLMLLQGPDVRTVVGAPEVFHSRTLAGKRNIEHLRELPDVYALTENGTLLMMNHPEAFEEAQGEFEFTFAFSVPRNTHSQLLAIRAQSPMPA